MPDFFAWSKVLPLLLYPLPFFLLLIFLLSWWLKPGKVAWLIRLATLLLWIAATPAFAQFLVSSWESPLKKRTDLPAVSDVAVVLGGLSDGANGNAEHWEFNRAAERITEAVSLWRAGRVKFLLITSGSGDLSFPGLVEAPGLAAWARDAGVPAEALVVEARSRNTHENSVFSLPLARARGWKSVVLITSAVHMPRSEAIFRKDGWASEGRSLVTWPVDTQREERAFPFNAVPEPSSLVTVQTVIKEAVGYAVYWIQGYL